MRGLNENISVEIFPYKEKKSNWSLISKLSEIEHKKLKFISVTYGASGSIQNSTFYLLNLLSEHTSLDLAAHLTCVNSTKDFVKKILDTYWKKNIRNIVVLGGDPPQTISKSDFTYAYELAKEVKENNDFGVSVAFHPEGHPKDKDVSLEIENLHKKVFYGADQGISQFFFKEEHFLRFRDDFYKKNKSFKLIPGIILISNFEMIERFALKCKTEIPEETKTFFLSTGSPAKIPESVSIEYALKQCERLKSEGIDDFHIYSLNKISASLKLMNSIIQI